MPPIEWIGASDNYTKGRTQKLDMIVIHWIVGTLASADATFTNPARNASATYGVGETRISQYVKESDTAWANGHSDPAKNTNPRSISIEHEGGWLLPDGTRKKPSPAVHENSAQLIADIVRRNPAIKLDRNHIKKHNEVSDTGTECPGSTDIDWLINRAKEILGGNDMTQEEYRQQSMKDGYIQEATVWPPKEYVDAFNKTSMMGYEYNQKNIQKQIRDKMIKDATDPLNARIKELEKQLADCQSSGGGFSEGTFEIKKIK